MLQRDGFIQAVVTAMARDRSLIFLSADFGAEALDRLRDEYPAHFVHCGISEQAMLDMATGLALEGRTVIVYAMAPFLSLRAIEQMKCGPGLMDLPIIAVSVGVGLGYADAGPTHYATEDFACVRAIGGVSVYTLADAPTTTALAETLMAAPRFAYVRLDRQALPALEPVAGLEVIARGWRAFGTCAPGRIALVSHGRMVHDCVAVARDEPERFVAIEVIRAKPFPADLAALIGTLGGAVVVDEQTPSGSLPAAVLEACASLGHRPPLVPLTLPDAYVFDNGGRDTLLRARGLSPEGIRKAASIMAR